MAYYKQSGTNNRELNESLLYDRLLDHFYFYGFLWFGAYAIQKFIERDLNVGKDFIHNFFTIHLLSPFVLWIILPTKISFSWASIFLIQIGSYLALFIFFANLGFIITEMLKNGVQMNFDMKILIFFLLYGAFGLSGLYQHFAYDYLVFISFWIHLFIIIVRKIVRYNLYSTLDRELLQEVCYMGLMIFLILLSYMTDSNM